MARKSAIDRCMVLPSQLQRSVRRLPLDRRRVPPRLNGGFGIWIIDTEACAQRMSNHDHLLPPPLFSRRDQSKDGSLHWSVYVVAVLPGLYRASS